MRYLFLTVLIAVISFYIVVASHTLESIQPYVLLPPLTGACDTKYIANGSSVTLNQPTNLTKFNVTNSNTNCFAIVIETSYVVSPPLIVATDHLGKIYFATGRLIVAEQYTMELEVSIYYLSEGYAKWNLFTRAPLEILQSGSIKPSESISFSYEEVFIVTKKCPLNPSGHLVDYSLTLRSNSIYESTMSILGNFTLNYDIYDRKSKYLLVECNYTIFRPLRVNVSLNHIMTLESNLKYWKSPSIVVLETKDPLNSTHGIIGVSTDNIKEPSITFNMSNTHYSAALLANINYKIDIPCEVKYLLPKETNNNCYDMIEKRCSYDKECPNSTCDALYNRCRYTTVQIVSCIVNSLDSTPLVSKYNTSNVIGHLVAKYSSNRMRRQVSYKVDPGCRDSCPLILVAYKVDEDICTCSRVAIVDVLIPLRNTCMNVDINYNPICGSLLRCGRCDGKFCIYEQTSYCYNLCFNPARTLAARDTCLTFSNSANASCIVDGVVSTKCNNTCSSDQFISYSTCNSSAATRISTGNIATQVGEVIPNRFNYGIASLGSYSSIYDWTALFNDLFEHVTNDYVLKNTTHTITRYLSVNTNSSLNVSTTSEGLVTLSSFDNYTYCLYGECHTRSGNINLWLGCQLDLVVLPIHVKDYNISGLTTINGGSLIINGNLTFSGDSILSIESVTTTPLEVDGCVNLGGTLNVSQLTTTTVLFTHNNCINGSFDQLILPPEQECHTINYKHLNSSIVLLIDFNCDSMLYIYLSIGVVGFALVTIGVIVVLYFKCKKVRREIAPFHDRKYWHPKKEEPNAL